MPKTHRLNIRFDDDEYATFLERANNAGLKPTDFLRRSALKSTVKITDQQPIHELNVHLARIGRDINTVAHHCNKYRAYADRIETLKRLVEIERELAALVEVATKK